MFGVQAWINGMLGSWRTLGAAQVPLMAARMWVGQGGSQYSASLQTLHKKTTTFVSPSRGSKRAKHALASTRRSALTLILRILARLIRQRHFKRLFFFVFSFFSS